MRRICARPSVSCTSMEMVWLACRSALSMRLRSARVSWRGSTGDLDGGDAGQVDGDPFVIAEVTGLVVDEVVEVDGALAARHAVFVVTGEFEQVGD